MKKLLYLSLLFGCMGMAHAQKQGQALIDSLQAELPEAKEDTGKVNLLNRLSADAGWRVGNNDTALYYADSAMKLSEKLGFKNGTATAYKNIGNVYFFQDNYPGALKSYLTALKINEETGNKSGIATNYGNIGNIYFNQGNYPEALENYFSALHINEAIGDKNGIALNYGNIGLVYTRQGNYPEALKIYLSALHINEEIGDKRGIAANYGNIGIIYFNQDNDPEALKNYLAALHINEDIDNKSGIATNYSNIGAVYTKQGNYAQGLENCLAALKINKEIGYKEGIALNYDNIGDVYAFQDNFPEALKNYLAALAIFEETGNKRGVAYNYNSIGEVYLKLHHAEKGKEWLQKGLVLSREIGEKEEIKKSYNGLTAADSALGNFKAAYENYKMYTLYRDSLYNEENTKKLTQTEMQYAFDKKQLADSLHNAELRTLAAEKLSKQKTYTAMGAGLAALLLGFSGLVFRNNKKLAAEKQKSEDLLHNILPEEVSAELKQRGATTAKEFDAVTVLFTDFVNFTTAGERMNPKELVEELHFCFKTFDQIIDQYAIEKIKTVGDAYLAVSGLPNAHPQHAQNIVKAAKEIRDFMLTRRAALGDKTFEVRIGIHSGSVVAGIVGVKKFAYDIWGDTVNTAARMEQSGEAGKINISETTHQLIKDDFECTHRGEIDAKGKGKMKMYFVS